MAITVKARCCECECVHFTKIKQETEDIVCPSCHRRMKTLTEDEFGEIQGSLRKQTFCGIFSILFFVLACVCVVLWIGTNTETWVTSDKQPSPDDTASFFFGAIICALASLILGILGSLRRYVVEF